jgi:hypothetical protein
MSHVIKPQRAYITRRSDSDNARFVQREAEIIALQNGDTAEAARRRYAEQKLAAKARKEIKPIAFHLIRELGPRDSIANMLKDRFLEERHGRTALQIRDYMVAREVTMSGGGNLVFVDGGMSSGIESKLHALRMASQGVAAGEATLPSAAFVKPVTGLLCGFVTLLQAGRQLGGDTTKSKLRVKGALKQYLEAAEPFFH